MNDAHTRRTLSRLTPLLLVAGVLAAACGSSGGSNAAQVSTNSVPSSAASEAAMRVSITTHKGPAGTYLTDEAGHSLYLFAADTNGQSSCNGGCAATWPPLTGGSAQTSGAANDANTATTKRGDGTTQITYAGHPLYRYSGDANAGDTNGQGLNIDGGQWWLGDPRGAPITSAPPASSSSSTETGWS
jgi:predicted lipoprotein with Yx(FWY)xxD motif